jgi:DNA-binding NarL/FixJ family response regulator
MELCSCIATGRESNRAGGQRITVALAGQRLAVSLALDAGNHSLAEAWLETHASWLDWSGAILGRAENYLLLARFHCLSGDHDAAHQAATTALEHASNPRQTLALIAAHRTLGELLVTSGRHDEAAYHLSASLELADACSALFERALTQVALAELHIAADRKGVARELLDEAHAVCDQLGARPTLNRIAALQTTIQHDRAPAIYPAGLSRREVEVLRLVANGLTDAGVAEQLFISPRTVGTHLTSIYTKLDVSSRTAAARFAVEQGLV